MKEKMRLYAMAAVAVFVAVTLIWYAKGVAMQGNKYLAMALVFVALIIGMGFIGYGWKERKNVKKGLPIKDERSKSLASHAASCAYFISIWYLVALVWYVTMGVDKFGLPVLDAVQALSYSIIGMAVIFGACYMFFNRKGALG